MDSRKLRDALGLFSTGVCLVATQDEADRACAITVNSFASVSLEPPLVLWSVQKESDLYALFVRAQRYTIAVLNEHQRDHSIRYSQKGSHQLLDHHYKIGSGGAPVIEGALVNFECTQTEAIDGGDHTIILGQVALIEQGEVGKPLVFFGGNYRDLQ
ncbi:MAG: flavin reductase family protein [Pseudomonadota bacterium]